ADLVSRPPDAFQQVALSWTGSYRNWSGQAQEVPTVNWPQPPPKADRARNSATPSLGSCWTLRVMTVQFLPRIVLECNKTTPPCCRRTIARRLLTSPARAAPAPRR